VASGCINSQNSSIIVDISNQNPASGTLTIPIVQSRANCASNFSSVNAVSNNSCIVANVNQVQYVLFRTRNSQTTKKKSSQKNFPENLTNEENIGNFKLFFSDEQGTVFAVVNPYNTCGSNFEFKWWMILSICVGVVLISLCIYFVVTKYRKIRVKVRKKKNNFTFFGGF
jgi:hypothetical protein